MSQNRGFRRDNRSSYQMNNYSGRSGNQMNVNPWEGGMVPGGLRAGVAGLLPTPPQASSLISQLSSPEAQLAIASNLLTTLLRPQQQQTQVPSLLSLGALGQVGNATGYGPQSNYGHDRGRFQDLGQNRRKARMDQRRTDPYNKSMQGRHSTSSKGGPERKSGGQGYRSPNIGKSRPASGSKVGNKAEKKDDAHKDKEDEEEDKSNGDLKKPDEEDVKREEGEEGEDGKKRDWKEEKKQDDEDDADGKEKDEVKHGVKRGASRYSGIPDDFFFCHVCKKHMWDDKSFENHLKGRTHQLMMDKLDESYKIKVELMRHELQVAEQQREIEMDRIKRQGRKVHMSLREYCTMCDLHFYGNIVVHRKSDRHQRLKTFLHPRCLPCGKEFASRVEWDHHKLSPLHLRKSAEARKNCKADSDDDLGIEEFIAQGNDEYTKKDMKVRSKEEEEKDILAVEKNKEKEGEKEEEGKDKEGTTKAEATADDHGVMEEFTQGLPSNLRAQIPKYNPDVPMAPGLVKKITGFTCRACRRFFLSDDDAKTHCRTLMHYNNYVTLLKMKLQSKAAKMRREASANAKKEESSDTKVKRESDEKVDDEGNWKRRKVANEKDDDEDTPASRSPKGDEEMKDVTEDESKKVAPGEEKYDPLEADAEADTEPESAKASTDQETPSKPKGSAEEETLWAEVDRDIGTLLETVDDETEEGDTETAEVEQARPEGDAKDEKASPRTRGECSGVVSHPAVPPRK